MEGNNQNRVPTDATCNNKSDNSWDYQQFYFKIIVLNNLCTTVNVIYITFIHIFF